ncbi:hypothetical protein JMJ35_009359 [Cladonia borealis]|uniref:Inhibitor I9 domain-containing protein n=1 Tax=Cladonia borealis TaxID=184061 RepID=A0AA39V6K5_9LECA|nr:hypothetical protein JMJ35_009359 [Cladonia borealis]
MNLNWLLAFLGALAIGVNGLAPQRQVLITYPNDTPQATLNEYRNAIVAAGGEILHEFNLIKGFIAKASTEAIDTIHSLSHDYPPTIEDDQTVTTQEQGR